MLNRRPGVITADDFNEAWSDAGPKAKAVLERLCSGPIVLGCKSESWANLLDKWTQFWMDYNKCFDAVCAAGLWKKVSEPSQ